MPDDPQYTLQDLADLAVVSPRTIRYYVAQGLLPSPDRVGPGALYGPGHLARLRLIRRLQREHLPLAEVRTRLGSLDDQAIIELAEAGPSQPPAGSASEYVRTILAGQELARASAIAQPRTLRAMSAGLSAPAPALPAAFEGPASPASPAGLPLAAAAPPPQTTVADRSQWDRVVLVPDVELHVRRPLSRHLNKQVERLIAIARQLLEEDPS